MATPELLSAAQAAAELLHGTVYERYHGIDYAAVRELVVAGDRHGFSRLCAARAGQPGLSPATDPAVMEQARVLTASPLATLVRDVGISPRAGWDDLARGAFSAAARRGATDRGVATAWRQLVFHLSLCAADEQARVLAWIDDRAARLPARAAERVAGPLARLRLAVP
ncbi:hypothetical protein ACFVJ8_20790 [Streptomyces yangpuensis]